MIFSRIRLSSERLPWEYTITQGKITRGRVTQFKLMITLGNDNITQCKFNHCTNTKGKDKIIQGKCNLSR